MTEEMKMNKNLNKDELNDIAHAMAAYINLLRQLQKRNGGDLNVENINFLTQKIIDLFVLAGKLNFFVSTDSKGEIVMEEYEGRK